MSLTSSASLPVVEVPGATTPCGGCHAGCCRAYALPLTGRDIFRIVTELKVPFWKFVCRWVDPSCAISRGVAPHFFFDDDRRTPYVIGLLQTESRPFPGTHKCVFLEETDPVGKLERGSGRCSIYEHRPGACRIFPARVDEAGALEVYAVRDRAAELAHAVYELCPRPWSVSDLDPVVALEDLRECTDEMELFHAIALRWNDQPGPWPFFPDFLELIYRALAAT
jgi:Fe-S-cluster containining protein